MVCPGLQAFDGLWAESGAQAFQHLVQAVAFLGIIEQQRGAAGGQGFGLQGTQVQVQGRGGQAQPGQVFAQQALQVGDVLGGFCGAQAKRALAGIGLPGQRLKAAPCVHRPAKFERAHPHVAQLQPQLQLFEQALGAKHQRGGGFYLGVQLDFFVKHLGQGEPGVDFRFEAVGAVQRVQQFCAKTPHHTAARQGPKLTPGGAAHAGQRGQVRAGGGQGGQRQIVGSRQRRHQLQARDCY